MQALGVDGCPAGWLYVRQDLATGELGAGLFRHIEEILVFPPGETTVGIDMPIGLVDSGPRPCEQGARKLLGRPRSSSVFPVPVRGVLSAATYEQACRIARQADGRKVNRQTWNIVPKIREVDAFLNAHVLYRESFHEVHPELSFLHVNGGKPMEHSKKTAQGRADRERLVTAFFGAGFGAVQASLPRTGWARDDLLDAFAALWTARRVARGTSAGIPDIPARDRRGLRMQIFS